MSKCENGGYERGRMRVRAGERCFEKRAEGSMYCAYHKAVALARVRSLGVSSESNQASVPGDAANIPGAGTEEG